MNKKQFIQAVVVRSLPEIDKLPAALDYAEKLWNEMSRAGYGAEKMAKPRESTDYYAKLNDRQRPYFDQFWEAFCLKKGRNEAAMRWTQLGELDDLAYRKIIAAAEREAKREVPFGQVRKMAEGWLFERRYEDGGHTRSHVKNQVLGVLAGLNNELAAIQSLYDASKNPDLLPQIQRVKDKIKLHMQKASA